MRHPLLEVRVWHKWKRKMVYMGEDSALRLKLGIGFNVLVDRQPEPNKAVKIMHFTGIFDAERTKVYASDILRHAPTGFLWRVFYDSGRFQLENQHGERMDLHVANPSKNQWYVAGNQWEHPSLWKAVDNVSGNG